MDIPLPGYPQPFGTRFIDIVTHQGPTSYTTGGENVGVPAGWGSIDRAGAGQSFNNTATGQYSVQVLYPIGQAPLLSGNSIQLGGVPTGSSSIKLKWSTASNGTEVASNTNLSGEFVRVDYYGG